MRSPWLQHAGEPVSGGGGGWTCLAEGRHHQETQTGSRRRSSWAHLLFLKPYNSRLSKALPCKEIGDPFRMLLSSRKCWRIDPD